MRAEGGLEEHHQPRLVERRLWAGRFAAWEYAVLAPSSDTEGVNVISGGCADGRGILPCTRSRAHAPPTQHARHARHAPWMRRLCAARGSGEAQAGGHWPEVTQRENQMKRVESSKDGHLTVGLKRQGQLPKPQTRRGCRWERTNGVPTSTRRHRAGPTGAGRV